MLKSSALHLLQVECQTTQWGCGGGWPKAVLQYAARYLLHLFQAADDCLITKRCDALATARVCALFRTPCASTARPRFLAAPCLLSCSNFLQAEEDYSYSAGSCSSTSTTCGIACPTDKLCRTCQTAKIGNVGVQLSGSGFGSTDEVLFNWYCQPASGTTKEEMMEVRCLPQSWSKVPVLTRRGSMRRE